MNEKRIFSVPLSSSHGYLYQFRIQDVLQYILMHVWTKYILMKSGENKILILAAVYVRTDIIYINICISHLYVE